MNRCEVLLYRILLLAFPRQVRRAFGDDMLRMFEDQFLEAKRQGHSAARVWVDATVDALKYGSAERWTPIRWRCWMQAFRQDIRYALRLLLKQPGMTTLAVVTLALGIGANTAIFSAVNAVLLRPLPYPDADRVVMIWEKRAREAVLDAPVAPADFVDWEKRQASFEAIAGMSTSAVDLTGAGEPVRLFAGVVSPAFFDVLGVKPALGRTFRPDEAVFGQHRVVILGDRIWRQRFGADPTIVGRTILLNQLPSEVAGVLPASFEFPDSDLELWTPLALTSAPQPPSRTLHFLTVYARLKPGITLERARADMDRIGAQLAEEYPASNQYHGAHIGLLRDELQQGSVRNGLLALLGAVGFVLLIGCVNVANLLLARAAARRREMAIRTAVGASRARLTAQALTESAVLALTGGVAALAVATWGISLLRQIQPRDLQVLGADRLQLDATVLAFTFALSMVTGLIFGILPAWQLARHDVNESLKDGGRPASSIKKGLRQTLVVSEIALASLLLVGTGLTLRSFQAVLRTETGFKPEGLLTAFVILPQAKYITDAQRVAAYDEIERRIASLPGVRSVGATSHLPLSGQDSRTGIFIEGREPTPDAPTRAHLRAVTLDYFRTMGMRVIEGRNFTAADHSESPFVTVINETMARRYWPGQSPLGTRVRMGGPAWREVVGIVADVKHWGFERAVNPEMYLPQKQMVWSGLTYVLATDVDPVTLTAAVRNELKAVDPDLPLSNVRTIEEVAARSVAARRSSMLLLGVFSGLALVLAAAGIYAVMSQLVALRTSEIGVRMTLGAQPASVMRLVLREGLLQAIAGLAIGLVAGVLVMRAFRSVLFNVSPSDPLTLVAVSVVLLVTATFACMVPARRAMRVDPVQALRS